MENSKKNELTGIKVHYISANHLAEILYLRDQAITILDARDEEAFDLYHIPLAMPYENGEVLPEENTKGLVVIYGSADNERLYDISSDLPGDVYLLEGGIEAWYSVVLFPDFLELRVRNNDTIEQIIRRSRFFGGSPRNSQLLNIKVRKNHFREGC